MEAIFILSLWKLREINIMALRLVSLIGSVGLERRRLKISLRCAIISLDV